MKINMTGNKSGMRIGESVFSICYLLYDLTAGIIFLSNGHDRLFLLYGSMTLLLCFGDAFHLIPRIIRNIKGETPSVCHMMNIGLAVTSVTMTVFYVFLYYIWSIINADFIASGSIDSNSISIIILAIAAIRIIICLLPQNKWSGGGNKKLSLCRNIIFAFMGLIEIILFFMAGGGYNTAMAVCIFLSFAFYMPVTLLAKEKPIVGMLMIPKTIMYMIMIGLGLGML